MNFIKSIAEKSLLLFLIFFFIYPITFWFMPITTRVVFGLLGGFVLLWKRRINYLDLYPMQPALLVFFFAIVAVVFNRTKDFAYITYCVSQLIIWLAAYFIFTFDCIQKKGICTILRFVVYAVLIQSFLSAAISTDPTIKAKLFDLIVTPNEEYVEDFIGSRFVGWGLSFFSAGVINGLGLICISFLIVRDKAWTPFVTAIFYGIILGVGLLLARTTLIGCGISIAYILLEHRNTVSWRKIIRFFFWLILSIVALVFIAFAFLDERIVDWAFELFINYTEYGSIESSSTDRLQEMYIFPQTFSTYIFGDGLFEGPNGSYYMDTDVGYFRLVFYFGIFGALAVFFWQYFIARRIGEQDDSLKYFSYTLFVYSMVLNLKGVTDMLFFLFLLFFMQRKKTLEEI